MHSSRFLIYLKQKNLSFYETLFECANGLKEYDLVHTDVLDIYYELTLNKNILKNDNSLNVWVKREHIESIESYNI